MATKKEAYFGEVKRAKKKAVKKPATKKPAKKTRARRKHRATEETPWVLISVPADYAYRIGYELGATART